MFRARSVFDALHNVLISPTSCRCPSSASFHTSQHVRESAKKREARVQKKRNIDKTAARQRELEMTKPHPVLGLALGDDAKWKRCDLAKILLREEDIAAAPVVDVDNPDINLPEHYNYGISPTDERLLFESLPFIAAQKPFLHYTDTSLRDAKNESTQKKAEATNKTEIQTANMLARLVDLRNANAAGIAFENRRRCVEAFSDPDQPNDTGRPEVQAAILTARIRNLWSHLETHKKDVSNRRQLRALVHQRARMLLYLERKDRYRFEKVLPRLGIEERAIRGELRV